MNAVPIRKASLHDLMVFTAATAVSLALARYFLMTPDSLTPTLDRQGVLFFAPGYASRNLRWWATIGSFFLTSWSVALLYVRLRPPRPKFREIVWSPGFLVSSVATLFVVAYFAENLATVARDGWPIFKVPARNGNQIIQGQLDFFPVNVLARLRKLVGLAPAIALLISVAIRRRCSTSDWVDRLGLALGLAWVLVYVL